MVAGCIPGEATVKLSAENIRRALDGEVVEVPMHTEVEEHTPIAEWIEKKKCPFCSGALVDETNSLARIDKAIKTAAHTLELLLNDGSSITGGVKKVGANIIYWAKVDTKIAFGTEAALCANSNKVEQCNWVLLLENDGSVNTDFDDSNIPKITRLEHIGEIIKEISRGCKCCGGFYDAILHTLVLKWYDKVTFEIVGDGKPGFKIAVDDTGQIASEELKDVRHWSKIEKDGRKRTGETGVQSIRIVK